MEEKERVKFYVELMAGTLERTTKRLWILCILLSVMLFASWIGFFVYESQFQDVVITQDVEQDAENGENHFIGGDYYGEAEN